MEDKIKVIETIKKIKEKRGFDTKDLARITEVPQIIIENILNGNLVNRFDINILNDIRLKAEKNKLPKLLKFGSPRVISFNVHKGGIGKTTLSCNIGYILSKMGYNVLLIDADDQQNLTSIVLDLTKPEIRNLIDTNCFYECFCNKLSFKEKAIRTQYKNLDIIAGDIRGSRIESEMVNMRFRDQRFKDCLKDIIIDNYYDFILVDTDKTLGALNTSILYACTDILMVTECSQFAIDGVLVMLDQIKLVKEYNNSLNILGIIANKIDKRQSLTQEYLDILKDTFQEIFFQNTIRTDANVNKAQTQHIPLDEFSHSSNANKDIIRVTKELLQRISNQ